jgi:hypothetical protein
MTSRLILASVFAISIFGAARCRAGDLWETGNSLFQVIGDDMRAHDTQQPLSDYETNEVCLMLGYFRGFAEAGAIASHYDATSMPFFLPDNITNAQIEATVYKFLTENPDKLGERGDALITAALAQAFPNPSFTPVSARGTPSGQQSAPQIGQPK